MTDLSDPRVPGGGAGKQVTLGGKTDSSGNPAGNVVIAQADDAFIVSNKESPTNNLMLQIWNPLTSGVNAKIVFAAMEGAPGTMQMVSNSSALSTDITANLFRTNIGGDAPLCEVYKDDLSGNAVPSPIDNGSGSGVIVGMSASNVTIPLDAIIGTIIHPGEGLVMVDGTGGANCMQLMKWIEESA